MTKQFSANLNRLHEMLGYVCRAALEAGFLESNLYPIQLAVEEALVNIINYAYNQEEGTIEITCHYKDQNYFSVQIVDSGKPYNPLLAGKMFDMNAIIEKQSTGGYGVFFILKTMDAVKYDHVNGKNVFTLIKYKPS